MKIRIPLDLINETAGWLRKTDASLAQNNSLLNKAWSSLQLEAKSRASVEQRISQTKLMAASLSSDANSLSKYVDLVSSKFAEADRLESNSMGKTIEHYMRISAIQINRAGKLFNNNKNLFIKLALVTGGLIPIIGFGAITALPWIKGLIAKNQEGETNKVFDQVPNISREEALVKKQQSINNMGSEEFKTWMEKTGWNTDQGVIPIQKIEQMERRNMTIAELNLWKEQTGWSATGGFPVMEQEQFLDNRGNWPEFNTQGNPHNPNSNYPINGNCTWYAYGRMLQMGHSEEALKSLVPPGSGSAHLWANNARAADIDGLQVISGSNTILDSIGDMGLPIIAQWDNQHVAVVEQVVRDENGNIESLLVSESHYHTGGPYNTASISPGRRWPDNLLLFLRIVNEDQYSRPYAVRCSKVDIKHQSVLALFNTPCAYELEGLACLFVKSVALNSSGARVFAPSVNTHIK